MYSNFPPTERHIANLEALVGQGRVSIVASELAAISAAAKTEIVLGHRYLRQVLPIASQLKWVQATAAGVDQLPCDALRARHHADQKHLKRHSRSTSCAGFSLDIAASIALVNCPMPSRRNKTACGQRRQRC